MLTVKRSVGNDDLVDRRTTALAAAWLETKASSNTRVAYERDLLGFIAWCDERDQRALDARTGDLDAYRDACLIAGASPATVTRRLSGIASFFRFVTEAGARGTNPADDVERPAPDPQRPVLDDRERAALVEAAADLGPKTAALVALLALDGMKLGEVLAVDVPRVRIANGAVAVELTRRGRRTAVAVAPDTATAVTAYVATRRRGPLFLGDSAVADRPTRLTRFGADFLIKRAAVAAGIPKPVSASMLRRSYMDAEHRAGTPLADIAEHVGHREVRETARIVDDAAR
jgi:site-specific recombinase XerD